MKKYFSMIALAIASVMSFSSCSKEEKTEIVDPLAGKHKVEATIHAEITGALTKAVAIEVEYKDFDGKVHKEVVNGKFDGQNATFDASFETIAQGDDKEAYIYFKGITGDTENYKTAVSPWGVKCSAVAKLDGNVKAQYFYDGSETKSNVPLLGEVGGVTVNNAYLACERPLETRFTPNYQRRELKISVRKTDVLFDNWPK